MVKQVFRILEGGANLQVRGSAGALKRITLALSPAVGRNSLFGIRAMDIAVKHKIDSSATSTL
jgi:hypothetical protein